MKARNKKNDNSSATSPHCGTNINVTCTKPKQKKFIELETCILTSLKRSTSSYIKRLNLVTYRNNSEISHCGKHYILLLGNLCKEIEEWGTKCKDGMTDTKTQH